MCSLVNQELGEKILYASKIMVNILAEALVGAKVQGLSAPQYRILDMIYNGVDKPAELARMLDIRLVISAVSPDPSRPEYRYVVTSNKLNKQFRLSDSELEFR